jgi:predicted nucleic acid-binding protein
VIVLDTNVVSELMKPAPAGAVVAWIGAQPTQSLYTTSITQAEILHGVMLLPGGKRREALEAAAQVMFREDFGGRILAFGADAALPYAQIAVDRRAAGRPISQFDAQIAAIARSFGATLATRNVTDFDGCGIELINPWEADQP